MRPKSYFIRAQIIHICIFFLVFLSGLILAPAQAQVSTDSPPIELSEGWQYRWGDSPLNEAGIPIWIYEDSLSNNWKPIAYKKGVMNPPNRHGEKNCGCESNYLKEIGETHIFSLTLCVLPVKSILAANAFIALKE